MDRSLVLLIAGIAGRDPRTVTKALRDPSTVGPMVRSSIERARREAERLHPNIADTHDTLPPTAA